MLFYYLFILCISFGTHMSHIILWSTADSSWSCVTTSAYLITTFYLAKLSDRIGTDDLVRLRHFGSPDKYFYFPEPLHWPTIIFHQYTRYFPRTFMKLQVLVYFIPLRLWVGLHHWSPVVPCWGSLLLPTTVNQRLSISRTTKLICCLQPNLFR